MNIQPRVIPYYYVNKIFIYDEVNGGLIRKNYNGSRPSPDSKGYISMLLTKAYSRKKFFEHRMVYLLHNKTMDQSLSIDHINGVKHDNRIENLRLVTHQENNFNTHTAKGYYWRKRNRIWQSEIKVGRKTINLGTYDTILDARAAYLRAKKKYHVIEER